MSENEPDYLLSIDGMHDGPADSTPGASRRWLGVRFDCCGIYQRIYRTKDGAFYRGRCPRCLRQVQVKIGPGGTNARFFAAE